MEKDYRIDYEIFSALEIIKIIEFFNLIEQTKVKKVSKTLLREKYQEYKKIINNKSLEKKYDKMLEEKTGISIYRIMKSL